MKKIIKIVLVLFVTLTLGACGSSEEKDTNKHTKTEEKKKEKIYTIGETVTYTKNSNNYYLNVKGKEEVMQPATKKSKQRDAIIKFLMTRKDHPTADMVYMNIKEEFPKISLGTVYRNLALLSERGEILKLSYEGGADHYDACTDPHYHFVCQECGSVIDLDMAPIDEKLNEIASENFPGEITQNVVYFKGICKNCLKKH